MKCALLLFGLSFCEYEHWHSKKKTQINYADSYDNYQKYIYKYFYDKGYSIDVYFSTNISNNEEHKKLITKYKPVKHSFIENEEKNKSMLGFWRYEASRNKKLLNVIELCLNNNIDYDSVLITRFDLLFQKDFEKSNIKLDKFNLVSVLERGNLICDNFYLLPFNQLKQFHTITKNNINKSFHCIKDDIEKIVDKENVNYILNERKNIDVLSFYKVVRNYL
tara:strand:- start:16436 stop:17098 length:663 start_codon:yes stop_codon:yes gene_type:complete